MGDGVSFRRSLLTWEFALFISAGIGAGTFGLIAFHPDHWVFYAGIVFGVGLDQAENYLTARVEGRLGSEGEDSGT